MKKLVDQDSDTDGFNLVTDLLLISEIVIDESRLQIEDGFASCRES